MHKVIAVMIGMATGSQGAGGTSVRPGAGPGLSPEQPRGPCVPHDSTDDRPPLLQELSSHFVQLYVTQWRPSVPPEQFLRALLLQAPYTIRRERLVIEQLEYKLATVRHVDAGARTFT